MIKILALFLCITPIILLGYLVSNCFIRYMEYITEREKKARKRKERLMNIENNIRRRSSLRMNTI